MYVYARYCNNKFFYTFISNILVNILRIGTLESCPIVVTVLTFPLSKSRNYYQFFQSHGVEEDKKINSSKENERFIFC